MDKYHVDYSHQRGKWCVWEQLTSEIRDVVAERELEQDADELADKMNGGPEIEIEEF